MNKTLQQTLLNLTHASCVKKTEVIQSLWSGYGEIARFQVDNGCSDTVVIKHVKLLDQTQMAKPSHPRGWNTDLSHNRKIKSYEVESHWYETFSGQCDDACRVPRCYGVSAVENEFLIVLEDLDRSGFSVRKTKAAITDMQLCLNWLAHFHATFLTSSVTNNAALKNTLTKHEKGLWSVGCYWHLDTRPDELAALQDKPLKYYAQKIDELLKACPYQTLVHGDAKLANFCFADNGKQVAAVDFQYVGVGIGMKDVAYFIGSCLDGRECEQYAESLLDDYFQYLHKAMKQNKCSIDSTSVEAAWRPLFSVAWADFHRFLKGWSTEHWKIHGFSERITQQALQFLSLKNG